MAMYEAKALPCPEKENHSQEGIRLIVADSEPIFRVVVRKIVAQEADISIVAVVESAQSAIDSVTSTDTDVLLLEYGLGTATVETVSDLLAAAPALKIVLVMVQPTEDETVELMRRGVRGIVTRSIAPELLIKCIRKVQDGETWLDSRSVNWVIEAYRTQSSQISVPRNRVKLSPKELQIIAGVTQGLRNKDIAREVGTTEQVVKNYLRKVYDKLGVSDRLELALYCMNNRLLENYSRGEMASAMPVDLPLSTGGHGIDLHK